MVKADLLSESEIDRVVEAIRQAETAASAEFVIVVARAADSYLYIPLLWASLSSLALPALLWILPLDLQSTLVYSLQLATFLGLALLFRWPPIKRLLIPRAVKTTRASRLAREQFYAQHLHLTRQRNGLMLFVSMDERYVEILADEGLNDSVDQEQWDQIVAGFADRVRASQLDAGLLYAIETCSALLAKHFPRNAGDTDELPNRLVLI